MEAGEIMISQLRSKLDLYQKSNNEPQRSVEYSENTDIKSGKIHFNEAGAFFVIEKEFQTSFEHGYFCIGDILNIDIKHVLKVCKESDYSIRIHDLLFLDTETTGLNGGSGTLAFLIGLGYFKNYVFVLRQYFIRDYNEELAALIDFNRFIESFKGLVTFNGKAFDWNLLQSRLIFNRLKNSLKNPAQIDLLYPSRMLWKQKLSSCRLISLEENILDVERIDDIPGALIPNIYFNYLYDRNTKDIEKVIKHNELDILSMVSLMNKINSILEDPFKYAQDQWELLGVGQILEKWDDNDRMEECYKRCLFSERSSLKEAALKKLALYYKRKKDFVSAAKYLEAALECSLRQNIPIMIELSKIYEHKTKDITKAIAIVEEAINSCLRLSFLRNAYYHDLKVRLERLMKKNSSIKVFSILHC